MALIFIALSSLIEFVHYTKDRTLSATDTALAYLIVFNPIVLGQILTFYLDDAVYLLSITLISQLFSLKYRDHTIHYAGIIATIVLLINAKLTGPFYAGAICALYLIIAVPRRLPIAKSLAATLAGGALAIGLVGYHPYVTKALEAGTPFFLPYDEVIDYQLPKNFEGLSAPEKLGYSVFAKTDNVRKREAELKLPFSLSKSEIYYMGSPDVRLGGFGPLFALELLLFYGCTLVLVSRRDFRERYSVSLVAIAGGLLLISAFFPEPWWARYAPLLWASPLFCVLAWPATVRRKRVVRGILLIGLALAGSNSALALAGNLARTVKGNLELHRVIETARASSEPLLIVAGPASWFHLTLLERFDSVGVKARVAQLDECQELIYSYHYVIPICR